MKIEEIVIRIMEQAKKLQAWVDQFDAIGGIEVEGPDLALIEIVHEAFGCLPIGDWEYDVWYSFCRGEITAVEYIEEVRNNKNI